MIGRSEQTGYIGREMRLRYQSEKRYAELVSFARELARKNLENVRRFQVRNAFGIDVSDNPYAHYTVWCDRFSHGYDNTKNGHSHLLFPVVSPLTPELLEQQWQNALRTIRAPQEEGYEEYAEQGKTKVRHVKGIRPVNSFQQETVFEHTEDIVFWLRFFYTQGFFPESFSIKKAELYAYLHDVGEGVRGDIAALKGPKTEIQIQQERDDCISLIRNGNYSEEATSLLLEAYEEYENKATLEAVVVLIIDRFVGSMVHIHSEKQLTEKTFTFSLDRVLRFFPLLERVEGDGSDFSRFRQALLSYFIPSANWIRFFEITPHVHYPNTIVF